MVRASCMWSRSQRPDRQLGDPRRGHGAGHAPTAFRRRRRTPAARCRPPPPCRRCAAAARRRWSGRPRPGARRRPRRRRSARARRRRGCRSARGDRSGPDSADDLRRDDGGRTRPGRASRDATPAGRPPSTVGTRCAPLVRISTGGRRPRDEAVRSPRGPGLEGGSGGRRCGPRPAACVRLRRLRPPSGVGRPWPPVDERVRSWT